MRMRLPDLMEIYDAQGVHRGGGCALAYGDVRAALTLRRDSLAVQLCAQTTPLRYVRLRWAFADAEKRRESVRIYGDAGSIQWFQEEPEKITVIKKDGSITEHHRGYESIAPGAAKYKRIPSGHPEGWFEAMGNLYRSFMECIHAKEAGTFTEDMIDFPTVRDGVEGVEFVEACLKSAKNGNLWVDM